MREEGGLEACFPTTTYSKLISLSVNDLIVVQLKHPEKKSKNFQYCSKTSSSEFC